MAADAERDLDDGRAQPGGGRVSAVGIEELECLELVEGRDDAGDLDCVRLALDRCDDLPIVAVTFDVNGLVVAHQRDAEHVAGVD